jgi:hypothetical protein
MERTRSERSRISGLGVVLVGAGLVMAAGKARADTVVVTHHAVTATTNALESQAALGQDGAGPLVVYSVAQVSSDGTLLPADLAYRRVTADGTPVATAVRISDDLPDQPTNDVAPSVSGSRVVYEALQATGGRLLIYNVDSGNTVALTDPEGVVGPPEIAGDVRGRALQRRHVHESHLGPSSRPS